MRAYSTAYYLGAYGVLQESKTDMPIRMGSTHALMIDAYRRVRSRVFDAAVFWNGRIDQFCHASDAILNVTTGNHSAAVIRTETGADTYYIVIEGMGD